ncbi:MAG: endonuclease/exonuclease/phosphatase family protein [Verrucomicrobiaceae bacterium]|nr:endonuclease/exonuclease/phosphatase family protein [Verrucomicrobiaceae bacterium]
MTKWAGRCAEVIADAARQGTLAALVLRWLGAFAFYLSLIYWAALLALCVLLRMVGEQNITTAFLLYLPPAVWLLPGVCLTGFCLLVHRRCLLAGLVGIGLTVWLWMGYRLGAGTYAGGEDQTAVLSVMTYNRGQHMNQSLQPFKNAMRPDILLLQESPNRAAGYLTSPDYAEFKHGRNVGEHTILSRHPILEAQLLDPATDGNQSRPARFVIQWGSRSVSVYSVHLRTPREVLGSYMRGAFLWGVLGLPGTPWEGRRRHYQDFWNRQMADARHLLEKIHADPNPSLIGGDFNAPHIGHVHQMLVEKLGDAHAEAGQGFGFTFPGVTRNPLSLGGPWMRIDYIFRDRRWRTLRCVTEPDRPSQHRAVFASFSLVADAE